MFPLSVVDLSSPIEPLSDEEWFEKNALEMMVLVLSGNPRCTPQDINHVCERQHYRQRIRQYIRNGSPPRRVANGSKNSARRFSRN